MLKEIIWHTQCIANDFFEYYYPVLFSPNPGQYGLEKLRIRRTTIIIMTRQIHMYINLITNFQKFQTRLSNF